MENLTTVKDGVRYLDNPLKTRWINNNKGQGNIQKKTKPYFKYVIYVEGWGYMWSYNVWKTDINKATLHTKENALEIVSNPLNNVMGETYLPKSAQILEVKVSVDIVKTII